MKCKNCGWILDNPNAQYCPQCGTKLTPEEGETTDLSKPDEPEASVPPTQPVRRAGQPPRSVPPTRPIQQPRPTQPSYYQAPQRQSLLNTRTLIIAGLAIVIFLLLVLEFLLITRKPADTIPVSSPVPAATAEAQAAEPTPAPATPAPEATASPAPTATPAPASQEPEPAQDVSYPGLEVQPSLIWQEGNQTLFRVATQADNLNMRKGPGTGYDLVGQAPHQGIVTRVGKLDNDDGWVLILYNGTYGWVSAQYLEAVE